MAGVHQDPALIRARSDRRVTQGTGILEGLTPELNTPRTGNTSRTRKPSGSGAASSSNSEARRALFASGGHGSFLEIRACNPEGPFRFRGSRKVGQLRWDSSGQGYVTLTGWCGAGEDGRETARLGPQDANDLAVMPVALLVRRSTSVSSPLPFSRRRLS